MRPFSPLNVSLSAVTGHFAFAFAPVLSPNGMETRGQLQRHISKSASDLSNHTEGNMASNSPPTPSTNQCHAPTKTHSFLSALKARWARARSKDRKKKKSEDEGVDSHSTDYAADNSSDHSSSATQSPQHKNNVQDVLVSIPSSDLNLPHSSSQPPPPLHLPGLPILLTDEDARRREAALRQHSFFQLRVHLKRGVDLVARDKGGTSDPYVKLKVGGRLLYKSKTIYRDLNPVWDEVFTVPIEDPFTPVHLKVFDYDWGLQDDFMGSVYIDLTKLDLGKPCDLRLELRDPNKMEYLGEILLTTTLLPKSQEDKDQYFQRSSRMGDVNRRLKSQIWSSVVTIVLVEGKNLQAMDLEGYSNPYVKFRLGNEKFKSKVSLKTVNPKWLEQFDLHLYDDQSQELEVTIWDRDKSKDEYMGKCSIDLSLLERERTHGLWREVEEGSGSIFLLLTISGTTASETISDLTTHEDNARERANLTKRYALRNTLHNLRDVGHLTVKVYRATGLAAADLGGKSDPFCVLELVNARLQTQTEYKTLSPSWQKIFTFNVKDINSVLEVTVYDEDRDHKVEFLGKVAIPLLRIRNGEKRWYCLKDKKLRARAKGTCPMILLEMYVIWNPLRAWLRTINPKEEKLMQVDVKFKRQVFIRNVLRLKAIIMTIIDWGKLIQDWFEWEKPGQSAIALVVFVLLCHYFEPYMLLVFLLAIFVKYYIVLSITGGWVSTEEEDELLDEDDDEEEKDKEEKKSLKEKLQAIQEVTQSVQNAIGYIASLGEQVKNTFNFTVPFLSWLAMLIIALGMIVLYFVPMRYLVMAVGVNKFARKLIRPHTIPNNEILDLLSRVPDDENLIEYRELRQYNANESDRRRDRKRQKTNT